MIGTGWPTGGTSTYTCQVQGSGSPFKATLAWTDPSVAPGAVHPLVNNLDLVVKDPDGKLWLGNSFLTSGKPDDVNNVEEVFIPQPEAGTYTVYVKGTSIVQNTVPRRLAKSQDYALVYRSAPGPGCGAVSFQDSDPGFGDGDQPRQAPGLVTNRTARS